MAQPLTVIELPAVILTKQGSLTDEAAARIVEAWVLLRDQTIDDCIRKVRTGRTAVNFGHVPEVSRAIDWLQQDLEGLKGKT